MLTYIACAHTSTRGGEREMYTPCPKYYCISRRQVAPTLMIHLMADCSQEMGIPFELYGTVRRFLLTTQDCGSESSLDFRLGQKRLHLRFRAITSEPYQNC